MQIKIGEMIGRYRIIDVLGSGGLGTVYKAIDTSLLERLVAIKVIHQFQQQSNKSRARFIREAKLHAQLSHPNIVTILDFGEFQGMPFLVMQYIPGGTLAAYMTKPLPEKEAAAMLVPVARALHYAHTQKIIHRDVKPGNILINESGQPMLVDFGIAKLIDTSESQSLTGTGVMVGTPAYMSPEQIQGRPVDGRSDVYALGVVLFEMVTGSKPYKANTPIELTLKHLNEPVPRMRQMNRSISSEMEQAILKAMAKKPEGRYPDMLAFGRALEKLAGGQAIPVWSGSPIESSTGHENGKPDDAQPGSDDGSTIGTTTASSTETYLVPAGKSPRRWKMNRRRFLGSIGGGLAVGILVNALVNPAPPPPPAITPTASPTLTKTPTKSTTPTPQQTNTLTGTPTRQPSPTSTATPTPTPPLKVIEPENAARVTELRRLEKISVIQTAWVPDGERIVNIGAKAMVLIDANTMTSDASSPVVLEENPAALVPAEDGKSAFILAGSSVRQIAFNGEEIQNFTNLPTPTLSLAVHETKKMIAVGTATDRIIRIDIDQKLPFPSLDSNSNGYSVAFSPDGEWIACGTSAGGLLFSTDTGTFLSGFDQTGNRVKSVAFSPNNKLLASGSENSILLWNPQTYEQAVQPMKGQFGTVNALSFSPDSRVLAAFTSDNRVRLYDTASGKLLAQLVHPSSTASSVSFSPDGTNILSSSQTDGVIRIWGLE